MESWQDRLTECGFVFFELVPIIIMYSVVKKRTYFAVPVATVVDGTSGKVGYSGEFN